MTQRILLTQLRRIGDVLMTTPTVAAVRQAYPDAHIAYLTEPPSDEVLQADPHVDEVLAYPRKASPWAHLGMMRRLRKGGYDVAVDFFGNPRSAQLTRATGAARRIGFDFAGRRWAYTERIATPPGRRYAAAHKALLAEPLGVTVPELTPRVTLNDELRAYARRQFTELGVPEGELVVALCPVSRQPYKVWPIERWARLADVLVERYQAHVLLMWGPGEENFVDQVRLEMMHQALPHYELPSLLQMAALLERCTLYVGNDNGPRHFAIAVGTPTVTVFGRPHPENWTPPNTTRHRTLAHDPGCKDACVYPQCQTECLDGVDYKPVEAEVEALLEDLLRHGQAV